MSMLPREVLHDEWTVLTCSYSGNGKEKWAKIQAEQAKNELGETVDNLASQTKVKVQDAVQEVKKTVS